jgi:hypothetical protein
VADTCADEYYGGEQFLGNTTVNEAICMTHGVLGYCFQGALASFTSQGGDEFDVLDPSSGVYWSSPPGSMQCNSSGRCSTSTGTLGFSDLVWSELNGTSNVLEPLPATATNREALINSLLALQALASGNYLFGPSTPSATAAAPGVTPYGPVGTVVGWLYGFPIIDWPLKPVPLPGP